MDVLKMKVLIAYDGSVSANAALDGLGAAGLPPEVEAVVLSVAHAWPPPPPSSYELIENCLEDPPSRADGTGGDWKAQMSNAVLKVAARGGKRLQRSFENWDVHAECRFGSPARQILNMAEEWAPDLIVVGAQGRSAIGRLVLGSVSQKVLTEARCSVRVARARLEQMAGAPRVVIGVDGSAGSDAAVATVVERNWPTGTEILVIAVSDPISATTIGSLIPPVGEVVEEYNEEEREWAGGIVANCRKRLNPDRLTVKTAVESGDARRVLCEEATRWGADNIFLGARGMGRLDRMLLGSVSGTVAAHAHCSVEVVRRIADAGP